MNNFNIQKAFWQSYTKEKISDDDIIEINKNLYDFAKVLVEIQKNIHKEDK